MLTETLPKQELVLMPPGFPGYQCEFRSSCQACPQAPLGPQQDGASPGHGAGGLAAVLQADQAAGRGRDAQTRALLAASRLLLQPPALLQNPQIK